MIEVFADVMCPFTQVGLLRLVNKRRDLASPADSPASSSTRTSRRLRLRSNPACNTVKGLLG
jgi:hypothetical protein